MTLKDFLEVDLYPEDLMVLNIYMGNGRYQTFHSYVKDFIDDNRFCDCDVNYYGVDPYYGCRYIICDGLRTVDYGNILIEQDR